MPITTFPFKHYCMLPDYSLANKIREKSWDLDKIFPLLKKHKKGLKELQKNIKSDPNSISKVRDAIYSLAIEIKLGIKNLKFINFYDSALLYLYYRLLKHVFELCKKEQEKLEEEKQEAISEENKAKGQKATDIKKEIKSIERKINEHGELINEFDAAKRKLIIVYEKLVKKLRKERWNAEKQVQKEFSFLKKTLRSMENLNRKIKVEAIKTKNRVIPKKADLMLKIRKKVNPEDVKQLAKLVLEGTDRISKDVLYSEKLISKFEREMEKLKDIVENLKKKVDNLIRDSKKREEIIKDAFGPWDLLIKNAEKEIHNDLMQIFRNVFVEYKFIGTRGI